MKVTTNHLLSLARLPFHFWTELKGGKEHFDNPGSSLMSYASFRLANEFIEVPVNLYESVDECTSFIKDSDSLSAIYVWVNTNATLIATKATELTDANKPKVYKELQYLMSCLEKMRNMYETVAGSKGVIGDNFDPDQEVNKLYIQSLIDAKTAITFLAAAMDSLEPKRTPA